MTRVTFTLDDDQTDVLDVLRTLERVDTRGAMAREVVVERLVSVVAADPAVLALVANRRARRIAANGQLDLELQREATP